MPINGMELGSDGQLVIVDSTQGLQQFDILTMFDIKQLVKQIKSTALDGTNRYAELPEGWGVDLDFDKATSKLLDFIAANEAIYFAGGQVGVITMVVNINDADGTASSYRFTGGAIKLTNGGVFKGLDKVTQKATVTFARMLKIS